MQLKCDSKLVEIRLGKTCSFPKGFFVVPTFQPSLTTLPMSIIHTPSHGHLSKLQGTGCKEERSGMQHSAPTHLPHYCIFRLVELSLAQFDYMQCAEMQGSTELKIYNYESSALDQQSNQKLQCKLTFKQCELCFSLVFGKIHLISALF